jgi:hypothetical protein
VPGRRPGYTVRFFEAQERDFSHSRALVISPKNDSVKRVGSMFFPTFSTATLLK